MSNGFHSAAWTKNVTLDKRCAFSEIAFSTYSKAAGFKDVSNVVWPNLVKMKLCLS